MNSNSESKEFLRLSSYPSQMFYEGVEDGYDCENLTLICWKWETKEPPTITALYKCCSCDSQYILHLEGREAFYLSFVMQDYERADFECKDATITTKKPRFFQFLHRLCQKDEKV